METVLALEAFIGSLPCRVACPNLWAAQLKTRMHLHDMTRKHNSACDLTQFFDNLQKIRDVGVNLTAARAAILWGQAWTLSVAGLMLRPVLP